MWDSAWTRASGTGGRLPFFLCLRVRCGYRKLRTYHGKWQLRSRLRQNGCVRRQEGGRRVWGSLFKPALQPTALQWTTHAATTQGELPPQRARPLRRRPGSFFLSAVDDVCAAFSGRGVRVTGVGCGGGGGLCAYRRPRCGPSVGVSTGGFLCCGWARRQGVQRARFWNDSSRCCTWFVALVLIILRLFFCYLDKLPRAPEEQFLAGQVLLVRARGKRRPWINSTLMDWTAMDAWMPMLGLCVHADEHPRERKRILVIRRNRLEGRRCLLSLGLSPFTESYHRWILVGMQQFFLAVLLACFWDDLCQLLFLHRIPQSNAAQHALCARNHAHVKLI